MHYNQSPAFHFGSEQTHTGILYKHSINDASCSKHTGQKNARLVNSQFSQSKLSRKVFGVQDLQTWWDYLEARRANTNAVAPLSRPIHQMSLPSEPSRCVEAIEFWLRWLRYQNWTIIHWPKKENARNKHVRWLPQVCSWGIEILGESITNLKLRGSHVHMNLTGFSGRGTKPSDTTLGSLARIGHPEISPLHYTAWIVVFTARGLWLLENLQRMG